MDATAGVFTTHKLQALIDAGVNPSVSSRRDLAVALADHNQSISIHGVEAWFRHVDSNYNLQRESLSDGHRTYALPQRRWPVLLKLFSLSSDDLEPNDAEFRKRCFADTDASTALTIESLLESSPASTLIGRDRERRLVLEACLSADSGQPRFLLLEGDAGVGKSYLMEALRTELLATDATVLHASCVEGSQIPLLPIYDLVDLQRDVIGRRHPEVLRSMDALVSHPIDDTAADPTATLLGARWILATLAQDRTLIVMLDDLHWADAMTVRLLKLVIQSTAVRGLRLAFIGALRHTAHRSNSLRPLLALASLETHPMGPLSQADVRAILEIRFGRVATPVLDWVWTVAAGHPLHTQQVIDHLIGTGQLDSAGEPQTETLSAPSSIGATFGGKYRLLSAPAQELLAYASSLGNRFELAELQYLIGSFSTEAVIDCLTEAEAAGLISYQSDIFSFAHPAARTSIYDSLANAKKAAIHYAIGERMRTRRRPADRYELLSTVEHLLKGKTYAVPDLLIAECVAAAEAANAIEAWDKVIELASTALELDTQNQLTETERSRLYQLMGGGLHLSGDPDHAIEVLSKAAAGFRATHNELGEARALTDLLRIRANYGKNQPGTLAETGRLEAMLPVLEASDPRWAAWALDTIAVQYLYANDPVNTERYLDRALEHLSGEPPCREGSLVHLTAGLNALTRCDPTAATIKFSTGQIIARAIGDRGAVVRNLERLALAQHVLGRSREVIATLETLDDLRENLFDTGEHSVALAAIVSTHALTGDFDRARAAYVEARELIENTGYAWAMPQLIGAFLSCLVSAGEHANARALVKELTESNAAFSDASPFSRLRRRFEQMIADAEGQPLDPLDAQLRIRPPEAPLDLFRLPGYLIGTECAIRREDREQIQVGVPVIDAAYRQGVVFAIGWPFCLPLTLAKAFSVLGEPDKAAAYLAVTVHAAEQAEATGCLSAARELADALASDHLALRIDHALAAAADPVLKRT